jgi:hyperosmotically inducible protein
MGNLERSAALIMLAAALALPDLAQENRRTPLNTPKESYIPRQVRHNLLMLPDYGVFDYMEFRVNGSTVTLLGKVTRPALKDGAERAVKDVEGVEKIVNRIKVLPPSMLDDRIRAAEYRAIFSHTALSRYALGTVPPIHIIVDNGNVTLLGVVADRGDKNIAGIQANSVPGVFSVKNGLRVAK